VPRSGCLGAPPVPQLLSGHGGGDLGTGSRSSVTPPPTWGWLCSCSACPARDGRRRAAGLPPHRRTLGVGAAVPPVVGGHPLAMGPDHCSRRSQLVGRRAGLTPPPVPSSVGGGESWRLFAGAAIVVSWANVGSSAAGIVPLSRAL